MTKHAITARWFSSKMSAHVLLSSLKLGSVSCSSLSNPRHCTRLKLFLFRHQRHSRGPEADLPSVRDPRVRRHDDAIAGLWIHD
jgi:hypothetical protein